jgi:hypothetical protein
MQTSETQTSINETLKNAELLPRDQIIKQILEFFQSPDYLNPSVLSKPNIPTSSESPAFSCRTDEELVDWLQNLHNIKSQRELRTIRSASQQVQATISPEKIAQIAEAFEGQNENYFTSIPQ